MLFFGSLSSLMFGFFSLSALEDKVHVLINNSGTSFGAPLATFPDAGSDSSTPSEAQNTPSLSIFRIFEH
jgi:hypothetical protein